ncbi:MAG: hypothetical protein I3J02_07925 [Prevotella sp.]|nr:hypothetical protein [Prevotella sp.]
MKSLWSLFLLVLWSLYGWCYPADVVWQSQSVNSSESMPCGGGSIGMNVWVEDGDVLFYLARSGSFDENNTLLKAGRFRISLTPKLQSGPGFTQRLIVKDGYCVISDGQRQVMLWVDVNKPVVHVDIQQDHAAPMTCIYENWRHQDRDIAKQESFQTSYKFRIPTGCVTHHDEFAPADGEMLFYHHNADSTVFDATAHQQALGSYVSQMYDPLGQLVFGGKLIASQLAYDGTFLSVYNKVDYRGWRFRAVRPSHRYSLTIVMANHQGTVAEWQRQLADVCAAIRPARDLKASRRWWNRWWERSFIEASGEGAMLSRNYTLFRYMMGCNANSDWPTKFNGGLFTFDPVYVDARYPYTPDFRRWGGGTHTAQNQRLLYWPLLKSGDYDALKSQLDFYLRILGNAQLRSKVYWKHGGAAFTEQLENFGLPEHDEYGLKRPADYDPGMQHNAWLEYTWDTVLEFCQMALDAESYGGMDISAYIPWIASSLDFFDEHYRMLARKRGSKELDGNGKLVIYPGSGAETFKMAYNPTSTAAGLRVVTRHLIDYLKAHQADTSMVHRYENMLNTWPDLSFREVNGHRVISPAVVWERVNNVEPVMLYPVFPWHIYGVGHDSIDVALNTWRHDPYVKKFNGIVSWEQAGIWAADLGLTEEAVYWNQKKLADGPFRFPAFWGPGHDWAPDHNWGGSGMIGLQEMLMQEVGDKIYILPAWPRHWDVHFKLHCSRQTTVEVTLHDGRVTQLDVSPQRDASLLVLPEWTKAAVSAVQK